MSPIRDRAKTGLGRWANMAKGPTSSTGFGFGRGASSSPPPSTPQGKALR